MGGGRVRDALHSAHLGGWIAEALNVSHLAAPRAHNPFRDRIDRSTARHQPLERVQSISVILEALLRDIDAELLGNLVNQVRAETFDDFLDHAIWYQGERRHMEAGVIAAVVFEDTVRRIYRNKLGDDKGIPLEVLINELAKSNLITAQQSK